MPTTELWEHVLRIMFVDHTFKAANGKVVPLHDVVWLRSVAPFMRQFFNEYMVSLVDSHVGAAGEPGEQPTLAQKLQAYDMVTASAYVSRLQGTHI